MEEMEKLFNRYLNIQIDIKELEEIFHEEQDYKPDGGHQTRILISEKLEEVE